MDAPSTAPPAGQLQGAEDTTASTGCCRLPTLPPVLCGLPWLSLNTATFLGLLALDAYQLSALAVLPRLYPEEAPVHYLFQLAFFDFDYSVSFGEYFVIQFWVLVAVVWVWLSFSAMLLHALKTQNFAYVNAFPMAAKIPGVMCNALFLLLSQKLLMYLSCTYSSSAEGAAVPVFLAEYSARQLKGESLIFFFFTHQPAFRRFLRSWLICCSDFH